MRVKQVISPVKGTKILVQNQQVPSIKTFNLPERVQEKFALRPNLKREDADQAIAHYY